MPNNTTSVLLFFFSRFFLITKTKLFLHTHSPSSMNDSFSPCFTSSARRFSALFLLVEKNITNEKSVDIQKINLYFYSDPNGDSLVMQKIFFASDRRQRHLLR